MITIGMMSACAWMTLDQWVIYFQAQTCIFYYFLIFLPWHKEFMRKMRQRDQRQRFEDIYGQFGNCFDTHEDGYNKPFFEGSNFHDTGWNSTHILKPSQSSAFGSYQGKSKYTTPPPQEK